MFACKGFHRKFKFSRHVPPTKVLESTFGAGNFFVFELVCGAERTFFIEIESTKGSVGCRQTASTEIGLLRSALVRKKH